MQTNSYIYRAIYNITFILILFPSIVRATDVQEYYSQFNIDAYELFKKGDYAESFKMASMAKKEAIQKKNEKDLARSISNIASINLVLGNTEKALAFYLESYKISQRIDDIIGLESTLNNLSGVYLRLGRHNEALEYIRLLPALNGVERPANQKLVAYTALINLLFSSGQIEETKRYLQKGYDVLKTYENQFSEYYFLLADADFNRHLKNYDHALQILKRIKDIALKNQFEGLYVIALKNEIELHLDRHDFKKADDILTMAIEAATKLELNTQLLQLLKLQQNVLIQQNNYKEAYRLFEQIQNIESNISGEKVQMLAEVTKVERQVEETRLKLERFEKDQKILNLQIEQQKQEQLIWFIIIGIIVVMACFLVYWFVNKKELARQIAVNQQLKELDFVKDRVLANTSHELRTPLNGIIGLSEVIIEQNETQVDESTLDMIRLIKSSGEQLALVINDILEMSKTRSGEITIVNAQFDLIALIDDVIKVCSHSAKEKNVSLVFEHTEDNEQVFLDKSRLQQVLFNIIGNAVKFTDKGSVNVAYFIEDFGIELVISDTGIGIPENKIERILEGFEQVESGDTRTKSGSGLGLAIS
ncbi:MAG: tetratricopeptide repeat-containing sensor histidine kinase, partial [Kangiellaceae bacterium]